MYIYIMATIHIKRAYEPASSSDGYRVYIDRLWPRGLSHETFRYDYWDKNVAPSTQLREWFHADSAARWPEFQRRYAAELSTNPAFASLCTLIASHRDVTLLYSSHDALHNNAVVVRQAISQQHTKS